MTATGRLAWGLTAVAMLAAVGCVAVVFVNDSYGVSNDTRTYLSVAHNVAGHHHFIAEDGHTPVEFAPLYPFSLAVLLKLGASPALALVTVNCTAMLAIGSVALLWTRRSVASVFAVPAAVAAACLGYPVLFVAQSGWSETLFIAFTLASLLALTKALEEKPAHWAVPAAVFIALASMTRYVGVLLIIAAVGAAVARRRWRTALIVGTSALPLLLWMLRNEHLYGSAAGERGPGRVPFVEAAAGVAHVFGQGFVGDLPLIATILGFTLGVLALRAAATARNSPNVFLVFALIYGTGIVVITTATGISEPNVRLVSPLYVPTVLLILVAAFRDKRAWPRVAFYAWTLAVFATALAFTAHRLSEGVLT